MSSMDLLKKLYGRESNSKCCKAKVVVHYGNEGTSYYVCKKCGSPCDVLQVEWCVSTDKK